MTRIVQDKLASRRNRISGLLVVNKPMLLSSMGVVSRVRGRAQGTRTGHAGTLDPLATGVLLLGLGKATKQLDALMAMDKHYRTVIDLSITTPSFDLELEPVKVEVQQPPDNHAVEQALAGFTGEIMQAPPSFSAIKVGGHKSYELARNNKHLELAERPITVHAMELVHYEWPLLEIDIRCAKGFYVRALARDLGTALSTGGTCRRIHRTAIGPFTDEQAMEFDSIPDPLEQEHLLPWPVTTSEDPS